MEVVPLAFAHFHHMILLIIACCLKIVIKLILCGLQSRVKLTETDGAGDLISGLARTLCDLKSHCGMKSQSRHWLILGQTM